MRRGRGDGRVPLDCSNGSGQLRGHGGGVAGEVAEAGGPQRQLSARQALRVQHCRRHHRRPVVEQLALQQRAPRQSLQRLRQTQVEGKISFLRGSSEGGVV